MIDRDTRHQLIDFFTPLFEDERQRKAIVDLALGDAPVRSRIEWRGAPRLFTTELVTLSADIEVALGEPALLALLEECRPYVGNDQWPRLDQLCRAVQPAQTPPAWSGPPYPGLSPFTREQAPIFFGRARETRALVRELAAGKRFLCVVGASGSGKSSLVAAGLLAALDRDAIPGGSRWLAVRCVPGKGGDPFLALAFALDPLLDPAGYRPEQIAEALASHPRRLDAVAEAALRTQSAGAELLLWVDQMEELFSLTKAPAAVTAFIDFLDYASRHEHVRVVATLRADFYAACLDYELLSERLRGGSFPLSAPGPAALYQMITGPAELAGLALAEGLPERLAADAGADPGSLPLLAFTLDELYQARTGNQLTLAAYEALGGVRGAIGRRAEQVFKTLSEAAKAALPAVFRELVTVSDDGVATRRRAALGEVAASPGAQELVTAFSGARAHLLVGDQDIHDRPRVEVAHEALFSAWPPLSRWLDERRDDLRLRRQVEAAALEWRRCGRDPAYLWPHERLAPVHEMLDRLDLRARLEEPVKSFVRPEAERLLEELERLETSHHRRAEIGDRLDRIGDPRPGVGLRADGLPDIVWRRVPGGQVKLEGHAGSFEVEPFEIAQYPVTYRQYRAFLESSDGYRDPRWWRHLRQEKAPGEQYRLFGNCPADNVSWYDAMAFCRWLSAQLGEPIRLPTEWEWQQAATSGDPKNAYPWGSGWESNFANTAESKLGRTTAVGMYSAGSSAQKVMDLAGNVWEWCLNKYENPSDATLGGEARRVLLGGSWGSVRGAARAAGRDDSRPAGPLVGGFGFRVVRGSPI